MSNVKSKTAIFAGGCFWCTEAVFDSRPGVIKVTSGFTGGHTSNPSYREVTAGHTGHYEAVEVIYNPKDTTYEQLLTMFWESIDPTDADGQFADRGKSYHTAIFYLDDEQKEIAEKSKKELAEKLGMKIATEILPAKPFYPAEDYHQKYYQKNSLHYQLYKKGSGREDFLKEFWNKED